MPPRSKSQGESKQGLIITLVFFVLATIGLGVASYYGFAGQEKLEKDVKKADADKKAFQTQRDWYKFEAMMCLSYIGKAEGMDGADTLGTLKGQFDSGSLKPPQDVKDKDHATKVLKELETQCRWNGNQPQESLEGALSNLSTKYDTLARQNEVLKNRDEQAKKDKEKNEEELQAARKDYEDKLKAQAKQYTEDAKKANDDLANFRNAVDTQGKALEKVRKEAEEAKKALNDQLAKRDAEIKSLKGLVQSKQDQIEQFNAKNPVAPAGMGTDWRIVRMDRRGTNPYINLGSADHVKPQLTFTIHDVGSDGRPNPQPKGTLEVVNVLGPHLSQTRITSVKDRNRDPILERDVIYNASWNPNVKKHVAISGIIDLTGDGRDSLYEFMRTLERQNIVVDAYQDPKEGTMKGQITYQTDYLILGKVPAAGGVGKVGESDKKASDGQLHMQNEAKKYGVPYYGLPRFLEMIGYRLPRSTQAESSSLYNPELRPDQAPRRRDDNPPPPPEQRPDK